MVFILNLCDENYRSRKVDFSTDFPNFALFDNFFQNIGTKLGFFFPEMFHSHVNWRRKLRVSGTSTLRSKNGFLWLMNVWFKFTCE